MTLKEGFEGWKAQFDGSKGTMQAYASGYKKLTRWHNARIDDLTLDQLQSMIDTEPCTYATAQAIKKALSAAFSYAYAHEGCKQSKVSLLEYLKLPKKTRVAERQIFTDDEVQICFDQNLIGAIILLFTGLRAMELSGLKEEDIHLEEQWLEVRISKTKAGQRRVPIPDGLVPYLEEYISQGALGKSKYYFNNHYWDAPVLQNHIRHECRHFYITKLTQAGVDARLIKLHAGHANSVTEDVYTHIPMEEMIEIVNKAFGHYFPAVSGFESEYHHRLSA